MTSIVDLKIDSGIAVITSNNPPVNALSHAVRKGLQSCLQEALKSQETRAVVILCAGRSFFAGADIREFGKPPQAPYLTEVISEIEAAPVPVIAAIHGTALGGGLEVALGAHYRLAADSAKLGLPEVSLGLLPGAGGTQRLPRVIPMADAAEMITGGKPISAKRAHDLGLVDKVVPKNDLPSAALAYAGELIEAGAGPRPSSQRPCSQPDQEQMRALRRKVVTSARSAVAPMACLDVLGAASELDFGEGLKRERSVFLDLMKTDQSSALRHAFFAERTVSKLPEIEGVAPRAIERIGVIGGGTMGAGIAASAVLNGLDVTLAERDEAAATAAQDRVEGILNGAVKRGKLSEDGRLSILTNTFRVTTDYADFAQADLVIEAVFESMEVKKEVFSKLDQVCRDGAILASNTSYLNLDEIAAMTRRPQDVIGLHFFSPAHVMRLLEVVVGEATGKDVTATAFALAKKLRKIAVRAGVCDGFIGNRILSHYNKAIYNMVLDGASPFVIDNVLMGFGLAMGPFAVSDLAGLDISWANRKRLAATRNPNEVYPEFADNLCELGRFGRKSGRGYYIYDENSKTGRPDPEVEEIIAEERSRKGITPRNFRERDILSRYIAAMVNESARVVGEGIALRPLDVDVTLLNGYGFPRLRGGPMQYADTIGLARILDDILRFQKDDPFFWRPAPLLEQLVADGQTFASLNT